VSPEDLKFYIDTLKSEECLCGRTKGRGKAFCWRCWKALPAHMQKALYSRVGQGFEEAYEEAVQWLQLYHW